METLGAIFNHTKSSIECIESGDIQNATWHLEQVVLPALAEMILSSKPPPPNTPLWNSLIQALITKLPRAACHDKLESEQE